MAVSLSLGLLTLAMRGRRCSELFARRSSRSNAKCADYQSSLVAEGPVRARCGGDPKACERSGGPVRMLYTPRHPLASHVDAFGDQLLWTNLILVSMIAR